MSVVEYLCGWGNYEKRQCTAYYLNSRANLQRWISASNETYIARGFGRSYGDAAVNAGGSVLHQSQRNHFLDFDDQSGMLTCEAGVSLAEIIAVFLPRGWFLPTTPGTKFVSVGGAIAADVHGKNHHMDGSWGAFVRSFDLLLPGGQIQTCSRTQNQPLFRATIGGMGLTGIILQATIQLKSVKSAWVEVTYKRARDLNETFSIFAENAGRFRHAVAWIDCVSRGARMGRSICMFGNDAAEDIVPVRYRQNPFRIARKRHKTLFFDFPSWVLNPLTVKAFNRLYYAKNNDRTELIDYDSFFYPLDNVSNWNRIYGKNGFIQYQAFLPRDTAEIGYQQILERITAAGFASFLAIFKSCGAGREGILSFLDQGYTLALDLPNTGDRLRQLAADLDKILIYNGGRLYLAKDTLTSKKNFSAMYPQLPQFKGIKSEVDPQQQIVSDQARRLGLMEVI